MDDDGLRHGLQVPDTLDLSEHGRMAVNGLTGTLNPDLDFECTFRTIFDVHPPYMLHWSSMVSGVMPKYLEGLPLVRQMSGSDEHMDIQDGFMDAMLRNMEEDGLVYDRALESRPWNVGVGYGEAEWNEDYACMAGNGRLIAGLINWHEYTGAEEWKRLAKKTAERMYELAIVRDDIAYYPNPGLGNDFSYPRQSGWTTTEPPEGPEEGYEGATMFHLLQPVRGFTRYYGLTGDERFLELSRKFVNLGVNRRFWGADFDMVRQLGAERCHFRWHAHANTGAIRGLLDYAVASNDARLKCLARDGYEWARQHGIHRLGLTTNGTKYGTEGCTVADMIALGVAMTDAGLGDYWDDVELHARNGLVEAQLTDRDEAIRVSEAGPERPKNAKWGGACDVRWDNRRGVLEGQEIHDNVIDRNIGAFGWVRDADYLTPMLMHCCTINGSQGLYYAWEGIVRKRSDMAEINMWLNRRSPWVDVCSCLPHEGKLIIHNKGMKGVNVRRPGWAKREDVRCRVDGRDVNPTWIGNRMLFGGLRGNEQLELDVPVHTDSAQYTIAYLHHRDRMGCRYDCEFRGNTAVKVALVERFDASPAVDWYRAYRRSHMLAERTPMKDMPAYVHPERVVKWQVG